MGIVNSHSGWSLAQAGKFQAAYAALSREIQEQPANDLHYMNRGFVLLNLSQVTEAERDFEKCSELVPDSSMGHIMVGIARWIGEDRDGAVTRWYQALNAPLTDEAGGVEAPALIYYSAISAGDGDSAKQARTLMQKKWRPSLLKVWPGPIIGYLLGRVPEDVFLLHQSFRNSTLEARRICRAHFWVAVRHLERGSTAKWREHMQLAAKTPQLLAAEYYLARHELGAGS